MAGTVERPINLDSPIDLGLRKSENLVVPALPVSARIPAECELLANNKPSPGGPASIPPVVAIAHEMKPEENSKTAPSAGRVRSLVDADFDQPQENNPRPKRQRKPPSAFNVSLDSREENLMRKAIKASLLDTKIEDQAEVAEGKTYR